MYWTNSEIRQLLKAANDGKDLERLSRWAFYKRFTSDDLRNKLRALSYKAFTKIEDQDLLAKKDLVKNDSDLVSFYFQRPLKTLQERLCLLQRSELSPDPFKMKMEKGNATLACMTDTSDFLLKSEVILETLSVKHRILIESKSQLSLDRLISRVSVVKNLINMSNQQREFPGMKFVTKDEVEHVFYYAAFTGGVVIYIDINGFSKYGKGILHYMQVFRKVSVIGTISDANSLDPELLKLFSRYKFDPVTY